MDNSLNVKYGLKRVINASGRMSILGVSAPTDSVMEAMKAGGRNYVEMADFVNKSGDYIAQLLGAEAAVIVNSASSGIALSVASLVTQGDPYKSERLHQDPIEQNEIIILNGHQVNYGAPITTMIALGGGKVVTAGYANEGKAEHLAAAITPRTAAMLYVKSHHAVQKNTLSEAEAWEVAQQHQIPLIIDAAAEEDLQKYIQISDLAIYSGSKAIEGPTTGIVCGKKAYVEGVKVQLNGIGRSMKVGKESMFGLLHALEQYFNKETGQTNSEKEALDALLTLNDVTGVQVTIVQDEAGREIYRGRVQIDEQLAGKSAVQVVTQLREGDVAIYTRDYGASQGFFDIDVRSLQGDDLQVMVSKISECIGGHGK